MRVHKSPGGAVGPHDERASTRAAGREGGDGYTSTGGGGVVQSGREAGGKIYH